MIAQFSIWFQSSSTTWNEGRCDKQGVWLLKMCLLSFFHLIRIKLGNAKNNEQDELDLAVRKNNPFRKVSFGVGINFGLFKTAKNRTKQKLDYEEVAPLSLKRNVMCWQTTVCSSQNIRKWRTEGKLKGWKSCRNTHQDRKQGTERRSENKGKDEMTCWNCFKIEDKKVKDFFLPLLFSFFRCSLSYYFPLGFLYLPLTHRHETQHISDKW